MRKPLAAIDPKRKFRLIEAAIQLSTERPAQLLELLRSTAMLGAKFRNRSARKYFLMLLVGFVEKD